MLLPAAAILILAATGGSKPIGCGMMEFARVVATQKKPGVELFGEVKTDAISDTAAEQQSATMKEESEIAFETPPVIPGQIRGGVQGKR